MWRLGEPPHAYFGRYCFASADTPWFPRPNHFGSVDWYSDEQDRFNPAQLGEIYAYNVDPPRPYFRGNCSDPFPPQTAGGGVGGGDQVQTVGHPGGGVGGGDQVQTVGHPGGGVGGGGLEGDIVLTGGGVGGGGLIETVGHPGGGVAAGAQIGKRDQINAGEGGGGLEGDIVLTGGGVGGGGLDGEDYVIGGGVGGGGLIETVGHPGGGVGGGAQIGAEMESGGGVGGGGLDGEDYVIGGGVGGGGLDGEDYVIGGGVGGGGLSDEDFIGLNGGGVGGGGLSDEDFIGLNGGGVGGGDGAGNPVTIPGLPFPLPEILMLEITDAGSCGAIVGTYPLTYNSIIGSWLGETTIGADVLSWEFKHVVPGGGGTEWHLVYADNVQAHPQQINSDPPYPFELNYSAVGPSVACAGTWTSRVYVP